MELDYQKYIPKNFPDKSRTWIYQSNRSFTHAEENEIKEFLAEFIVGWNTHGNEVSGFGQLFYNRFIVLMADETKFGVSGCSTDSSVRMIKQIEKKFDVQLLDRLMPALIIDNEVRVMNVPAVKKAFEENSISKNTLYFNNMVLNKKEFCEEWLLTLEEGWLGKKLNLDVQSIKF